MKIESIIKRRNGHSVTLDGKTYEFLPPDYVADVTDEAHAERFLAIPEGYGLPRKGGEKAQPKPQEPTRVEEVDYALSEVHPSEFEINGTTYEQAEIVKLAADDRTAEQWNSMSEGERADLIDETLEILSADTNGDGEVDGDEERAHLVKQYQEKFGKKPHHKWKADKIRAELEGAQ